MEWFQHFNITNFSIFYNVNFFNSFDIYFSLSRSFQTQGTENILRGLIIIYWKILIGYGIVFQLLISQIVAILFMKLAFFKFFWQFLSFFLDSRAKEPRLGFENRLLYNFSL